MLNVSSRKNLLWVTALSTLAIANCSLCATAQAAPAISTVSGSVSNGSTVTISGSGFGNMGPNIILFDDFEKGANGNTLSHAVINAQIGTWRDVSAKISPYFPTYSNLQAHSGSLALRQNWGSGSGQQEGARWVAPTINGAQNHLYFSFWTYLPTGQNVPGACCGSGPNWKVWWASSNDGYATDYASEVVTDPPKETSICWVDGSQNRACVGYQPFSFSKGQWNRIEVELVGSTGAGKVARWDTNPTLARNLFGTASGRTLDDGVAGWSYLHFPGFGRYDSNSNTYYDDIYVASGTGALARVEVGNASTFNGSTNLAVATVNSWSDTSVQATIRQGSFQSGIQAYLYVIDANGNVNSQGYPITIGQGSSGISTPQKLCIVNPQTGLCQQ